MKLTDQKLKIHLIPGSAQKKATATPNPLPAVVASEAEIELEL